MAAIELKTTAPASVATPPSGSVALFANSSDSDTPYYKDSAGASHTLKGDTGATGATGAAGSNGTNGTNGQGVPTGGTAGQKLKKLSGTDYDTGWVDDFTYAHFIIDGGGATITTGVKGDIVLPGGTIVEAWLLADQSGSIVVDLWKDSYANYPPVVGDSITASAKPTLSSANKSKDTTLTGWTTSVTEGDTLRINIDSATTVTRVTLVLKIKKS